MQRHARRERLSVWFLGLGASCLASPAVLAQVVTQTESNGERYVETYVDDGRRNDSYDTRITATLDGTTLLYDQTFIRAFDDPSVQAGLAQASAPRMANVGNAPAVVTWGAPQLIDSYEEFLDSFTEQTSATLAPVFVTTMQTTSGDAPDNIAYVGNRGSCFTDGVTGATNFAPFDGRFADCDNSEEMLVEAGTTNVNTHTTTVFETVYSSFTNEDYLNFAHYQLQGTATRIGTSHTAVQSGLFDALSGFGRRLGLAAEPSATDRQRLRGWLEGHSSRSSSEGGGDLPGNRRSISGYSAGVLASPWENWQLGLALDSSTLEIEGRGAPEEADVDLTQLALQLRHDRGPWSAAVILMHAFGDAESAHGSAALGGISTARYDVDATGASLEAQYRLGSGSLRLAPLLGADWIEAGNDGFVEQGGMALAADSHTVNRSRAWLGLAVGRTWRWGGRWLDVDLRSRAVSLLSGEERELPVTFAATPGTPLSIEGVEEESFGLDARLLLAFGFHRILSMYVAADGYQAGGDETYRYSGGLLARW